MPNGEEKLIFFVAPLILGDNLGLNTILGFNASFNSNYFCRICKADKNQTQSLHLEVPLLMRKPEDYQVNCYGIKNVCVFNNLPYFHCCHNVSCDIMHDLFEGVCRYAMAKIIHNFVREKSYFTMQHLNNRIKYFDYNDNVDIGNRIPVININHIEKGLIIMSSAEMHALVSYFAIICGDLVDDSDEVWHFYLLLSNIIYIVTAISVREEEILYLQNIISEFTRKYIHIFNCTLALKFHFLTHYPSTIKLIGSLTHVSSIQFESFHKIGKDSAHAVMSRVNNKNNNTNSCYKTSISTHLPIYFT